MLYDPPVEFVKEITGGDVPLCGLVKQRGGDGLID